MATSKHSSLLSKLETKLQKVFGKELKMTQRHFHDFTGYKQELEDLINNYYGFFSEKEERTIGYLKAEVSSRLRRLKEHLQDHGSWGK